MTPEFVIEMGQRTLETALLIAAPVLIFSLTAGLVVSLFQAVTQINEATLTFLPKILAIALALIIFLPWMMSTMIGFATQVLQNIPLYLR